MKTPSKFSRNGIGIAVLMLLLLLTAGGCDDHVVSPCCDGSGSTADKKYTQVIDWSVFVDDTPTVVVDNFTGKVTFRTGGDDIVKVRAIKRAAYRSDIDCIDVEVSAYQNEVIIRTDNPRNLKNVSVDLEITAPPDARPQIATGVGNITYQGRPRGRCCFSTGVGSIDLRLHHDINIMVDLVTGVGSIVLEFPVDGTIGLGCVRGRIGSGAEGSVDASTGVGSIQLIRL
jgi:hypothetical protein